MEDEFGVGGSARPPEPGGPREPSPWGQAPAPSPFGPEPATGPPPAYQPPGQHWSPSPPGGSSGYPRNSIAKPALVLSIMGLACCFLGPVGLVLGAVDLRAIDRGLTDPVNRGSARAAVILGAVGGILLLGFMLLFLFLGSLSLRSDVTP